MSSEKFRLGAADQERSNRIGLAVTFWVLIPLILYVTYWLQVFQSFGVVGCSGICNLDLSDGARAAYPWALGASVVAAIITAVVCHRRRKPAYWGPLLGVILVLLSAIVTSIVFEAGLTPMRERNNRIANGEIPDVSTTLPNPVGAWEASVNGTPILRFATDGTVTGTDGCNDLSGRWTQDSTGRIYLEALLPRTTNVCDGVDTWLIGGRSADILDDFMYVNGDMDSPIGGLQPAH